MKIKLIGILLIVAVNMTIAQQGKTIILNPPDTTRGLPVMKALAARASATAFDTIMLRDQDLADLLWAADGINRPKIGKRTAPSAMNAQDVDVYVCLAEGIYRYDAKKHALEPVAQGDHRKLVAGRQANFAVAPVHLILVSDISRFKFGEDSLKLVWAAEDAGIVSQNIAIFCAAVGLKTRPRASMDQEKLRAVMKLGETQHLMLNHPVSY
jgi:SagB-type dehydrogenase family enzyme